MKIICCSHFRHWTWCALHIINSGDGISSVTLPSDVICSAEHTQLATSTVWEGLLNLIHNVWVYTCERILSTIVNIDRWLDDWHATVNVRSDQQTHIGKKVIFNECGAQPTAHWVFDIVWRRESDTDWWLVNTSHAPINNLLFVRPTCTECGFISMLYGYRLWALHVRVSQCSAQYRWHYMYVGHCVLYNKVLPPLILCCVVLLHTFE